MRKVATMPRGTIDKMQANGQTVARREAVMAAFVNLVNQVPDAPEGDIADLLGPILAAASWEQLNTTDVLPSSKTLIGRELKLESLAKKVSDKNTVTGYYLWCEGVDLVTGESIRWTAGGGQAVAVMSQLYVLRALPAKIRYEAVTVEGADGDAINCKVLDVYTNAVVDG